MFVTPVGTVAAARLFNPFTTPVGSVWFTDLTFPNGWLEHSGNLDDGLWRFVSAVAPTIHDSTGKALSLPCEIGAGSSIRIAGTAIKDGRRSVLTVKMVSVIELVEPDNVFTRLALDT